MDTFAITTSFVTLSMHTREEEEKRRRKKREKKSNEPAKFQRHYEQMII
jgi:hypothetical protein